MEIISDDFEYAPFTQKGGLGAANRALGPEFKSLVEELTATLAA
jgi:type I restriction enzyme R subunit